MLFLRCSKLFFRLERTPTPSYMHVLLNTVQYYFYFSLYSNFPVFKVLNEYGPEPVNVKEDYSKVVHFKTPNRLFLPNGFVRWGGI